MTDWGNTDELVELFRAEAMERLEDFNAGLIALEQDGATPDLLQTIRRDAHSVKGSAKLLGFEAISQLAHVMEDVLAEFSEGRRSVTPELIDELLAACDGLVELVRGMVREPTTESQALVQRLVEASRRDSGSVNPVGGPASAPVSAEDEAAPTTIDRIAAVPTDPVARAGMTVLRLDKMPTSGTGSPDAPDDRRAGSLDAPDDRPAQPVWVDTAIADEHGVVRIELARVHELIDSVGEVGASRVALNEQSSRLVGLSKRLMATRRRRGRAALDPTIELAAVRDEIDSIAGAIESICDYASKQLDALQDEALSLAMFSAQTIFGPLPRLVRDLSRSLGKDVRLDVDDHGAMVDKRVLEKIAEPIRALMINAIDHGIEDESERVERGKPRRGTIEITAAQRSGQVVIEVADDGRGIDLEAVRDRAIASGALEAGATVDEGHLTQIIFESGFTTVETVSDTSGRGVGLDVVRNAIDELGGMIDVYTNLGSGTTFRLTLPTPTRWQAET